MAQLNVRIPLSVIEDAKRLARVRGEALTLTVENAIADAIEGMDEAEKLAFEALAALDQKSADDIADTKAKLGAIAAAMLKSSGGAA